MKKVGPNEPCLCGSGRKFRDCCDNTDRPNTNGPKIIPFPGARSGFEPGPGPSETIGFGLLADERIEGRNSLPQREFLGLSADHMYNILNYPFEENADIVSFRPNIVWEDVEAVPFLRQTIYFLTALEDLQPLPTTAQGNLPRDFVQRLYEDVVCEYQPFELPYPRKEDDIRDIVRLRHVLIYSGLVKKYRKAFSLTRKAARLLKERDWSGIYHAIFNGQSFEYLWECEDLYPEMWLIQRSLIFNLYILHKRAHSYVAAEKLGAIYALAFPSNVTEAMEHSDDPEHVVIRCFMNRFLRRYAEPMGLVVFSVDADESIFNTLKNYRCRTTALFERLFSWKV